MKVLVATRETQGMRPDDVSDTVPGEIVLDVGPCARAMATGDWSCACSRTFLGLASERRTTTARVADLADLGLAAYIRCVRDALAHWACAECARGFAERSRFLANRWEVGTIIERSGSIVRARETVSG